MDNNLNSTNQYYLNQNHPNNGLGFMPNKQTLKIGKLMKIRKNTFGQLWSQDVLITLKGITQPTELCQFMWL